MRGRSFAEYWDTRPGPLRTTLKRKARKVETEILTHFDAQVWADYETIYAASWKPAEDQPAMLRAFAEAEGAAGRLRLGIARAEGIAVAAQCWTVENSTAYIHKLAHLESHKPLSAGTTLTAALFAHVIDIDRVDLVDFGTGDQSYKADWMEEVRPRFRIDCLDPAQPKAWPPLAKRILRARDA
ncbi:MAG: GNAT family N-acetyltransferase [Sphingomonadales bacterium]|nr:MAG: GNAT family N-acetyltransferase [Sphingomonadales bacterium]